MSGLDHSGLELAVSDGLEVAYHHAPQAVYSEDSRSQSDKIEKSKSKSERICGVKKTVFWLVALVVLVIIISAGVVGGVVGSKSAKSSGSG